MSHIGKALSYGPIAPVDRGPRPIDLSPLRAELAPPQEPDYD